MLRPIDDVRGGVDSPANVGFGIGEFLDIFGVLLAGGFGGVVASFVGFGQVGGFAGVAGFLAIETRGFLKAAAIGRARVFFGLIVLVAPPGFFGIVGGLVVFLGVIAFEIGGRAFGFE